MSSWAGLKGRSILIAGSADRACPVETLRLAHAFVRRLVGELLSAGAHLVLLAGVMPVTEGEERLPLTFDWQVLEVLDELLARPSGTEAAPARAVVVTAHKNLEKMPEAHRELLTRLSARGLVQTRFIDDDVYTGGNIVEEQTRRADALVCLGGGKGVADRAHKMMKKKAPVLPLDLPLGAFNGDGAGAPGLLKKALAEPARFFPWTHERLRDQVLGLSLMGRDVDPGGVARRVVQLLSAELEAAREHAPPDVLLLTALPVELAAARKALGIPDTALPGKLPSGTNHWSADLEARREGRLYKVALGCFGAAGNTDAAAVTSELVVTLRPRLVVMTGIAAGMRGRCRLGEVLLSERVVAYEPAAEVLEGGTPRQVPRPEMYRLPHAIEQDVTAYVSAEQELKTRLGVAFEAAGVRWPVTEAREECAAGPSVRPATIASGEKLLRDPARFRMWRESIHGKIEVGEMEAVGVAAACRRMGVDFLIVRGISDFGDDKKDDAFHHIASVGAAIVAVDFIREALRFDVPRGP